MDTVYKLINMIIERGIDVATVMLLLTYQLPQFLNMTLPYASLMSVVLFMSRLSTDFELTAMHAAGISSWNIGSVGILFGGVITLLGWLNSLWLTPMGYRAFEEEKFRLLKSQKNRTIQPKVLNFDFGGKVLYVQEKDENDQLKGVFLSERDLDEDSMITVSDTGFIEVREKEQDLVLNLEKGKIHLHEQESSYRIIDFEKLFYVFRSSQMTNEDKDGHVWGKPTSEIWNSQQFSEKRELMMRLTTPAACFVICLTMFSLGIVEPRRGRSAALNMVITETGAGKAVGQVLPELIGKLTANAVRVPTPNVSLAIMNLQLGKEISLEELNNFLRQQAFHSDLKEQIGFTNSPEVVSTDFVGDRHAGIIDSAATIVNGDKCVLYVWYDNEFGYTAQLLGLAKEMVGLTYQRYPNFSETS